MRAPLLSLLAVFPLILAIELEYLSHQSRHNHGIVFTEERFSNFTYFTYLYLPTMLAVTYSMVWAWIDLDAKRLEPYFQMSKAEGASVGNSVLLHYPLDLVVVPPIKAFRQRYVTIDLCAT